MKKEELLKYWKENYNFKEREIDAFLEARREEFLPHEVRHLAYEDAPLPILRGKTISQPTTVMIMTHALEIMPGNKIFEVGTGSGFQTAVLSKLAGARGKVISTEVIPELYMFAKRNLERLKYKNIEVYEEDGSKGLIEKAPYDRILITAACADIPEALINQLRVDGIIVAPLGDKNTQKMIKAIKNKDGSLDYEDLGSFVFSPLYGRYGFEI